MEGEIENFYAQVPVFEGFSQLTDAALYRPLPEDWVIGMSDVAASAAAIRAGQYKIVNIAGAALIAAVSNALGRRDFPFAFGGDGATFALPLGDAETARAVLAATAAWGRINPTESHFIATVAAGLRVAHAEAAVHGRPRVLFSAHGLPEKSVKAGDPYQWQCDRASAALAAAAGIPDLDWVSTYQSRVGRLKWIEPSTEAVIYEAAVAKRPIVVVPIAFVSEHSETLVELDVEYRKLADESGAPCYVRVPTVGADEAFIAGLADLVRVQHRRGRARETRGVCEAGDGGRICPAAFSGCLSAMATGADPIMARGRSARASPVPNGYFN